MKTKRENDSASSYVPNASRRLSSVVFHAFIHSYAVHPNFEVAKTGSINTW